MTSILLKASASENKAIKGYQIRSRRRQNSQGKLGIRYHCPPSACCSEAQACPTLCDPMDCNSPSSSFYGIIQAKILEWIAMHPPGDVPDPVVECTSPA